MITRAVFPALLALGIAASAAAAPQEELQALRGRVQALQKKLAESEESKKEAADALRASERAISATQRKVFELSRQQQEIRAALERLRASSTQAQNNLTIEQERFSRQLYQRYLAGSPETLRLLLAGTDPHLAARRMDYYRYVARAEGETIKELRHTLVRLDELARQTEEKNRALARIEADLKDQQQRLEGERKERQAVYARISQDIGKQRKEIATLKRDETRLARLVEQLGRMLARPKPPAPGPGKGPRNERLPEANLSGTPFGQLKGKLSLPVRGELANRYGSPRIDGGPLWKGLLILAKTGDTVKAIASGRVVFADWLRGFGNLLILDHGGDYMSLYGNNDAIYRNVGDPVSAGDAIASVGSSGGLSESGLYFELRHQGKPFDPLGWVQLK